MKEFYEKKIKVAETILELAKKGFYACVSLDKEIDYLVIKNHIFALDKLESEIADLKELKANYDNE